MLILLIGFTCSFAQTRPQDLKYPPLHFNPPMAQQYRTVLNNGLRAYLAEDASLPVVNVQVLINFGPLYDAKEKAGLAELLAFTLIKGGTKSKEGSAIEERIDFLGGTLNFTTAERTATLSLTILQKDLNEGLALLFDVLCNPQFRDESIQIAKKRMLETMKQANDTPATILAREYEKLLYGDHPLTYKPFKKTIDALTAADLKKAHATYFFPKNMILLASGALKKGEFKGKINKLIAPLKNHPLEAAKISNAFPAVSPGIYFIRKAINQGYINMGHLGIEETNPDYFDVQVMNFILGGGSFTSRITTKVRSDEGLAYNTGSRFTYHTGLPGTFAGYVQTKSQTVGYAIDLIRLECERIRKELVSDEELDTAKNFYLESFSDFFQTPQIIIANFARLEMEGRPLDYYQTYRNHIDKVTKETVLKAAQKYIHPDQLAIMIVGNFEACNVTSEKYHNTLEKLGKIKFINLPDYISGEPSK
jgi:predicted Zn-dependent peptidase